MKFRNLFLMTSGVIGISLAACGPTAQPVKKTYKVSFDTQGGTPIVEPEIVEEGEYVSKPNNPVKENYDFVGWYKDEEEWDFANNPVYSDMTLTAHYLSQIHNITKQETSLYTITVPSTAKRNTTVDVKVTTIEGAVFTSATVSDTNGIIKVSDTPEFSFVMPDRDVVISAIVDETPESRVYKLINNIGTVEHTEECLAKINAASSAYNLLTTEQKLRVTNYDVLFAAEKAYYMNDGMLDGTFDEDNIVQKFGYISDIHNGSYIKDSVKYLQDFTGGVDALLITGDIGEGTRYYFNSPGPNDTRIVTDSDRQRQINEIQSSGNKVVEGLNDSDVPIIYTLGNHDTTHTSNTKLFYENLPSQFTDAFDEFGTGESTKNKGLSYAKVGDYHFIALEADYGNNCKSFGDPVEDGNYTAEELTRDSQEYLEAKMKEITSSPDYNGEFIFVLCHLAPKDSVVMSSGADSFNRILAQYPQAVVLSGHNHSTMYNERNIYQNKYTVINGGSLIWTAYFTGDQPYVNPFDKNDTGYQYLTESVIELDKDGNMRVTRLDVKNKGVINKSWIISAPQANNQHLFSYPKERQTVYHSGPTWKDNERLQISWHDAGNDTYDFNLTLDAAVANKHAKANYNPFIFGYGVNVKDASGNLLMTTTSRHAMRGYSCYFLSDFIDNPDCTKMSDTVSAKFQVKCQAGHEGGVPTTIEIFPFDDMFAIGEKLTGQLSNSNKSTIATRFGTIKGSAAVTDRIDGWTDVSNLSSENDLAAYATGINFDGLDISIACDQCDTHDEVGDSGSNTIFGFGFVKSKEDIASGSEDLLNNNCLKMMFMEAYATCQGKRSIFYGTDKREQTSSILYYDKECTSLNGPYNTSDTKCYLFEPDKEISLNLHFEKVDENTFSVTTSIVKGRVLEAVKTWDCHYTMYIKKENLPNNGDHGYLVPFAITNSKTVRKPRTVSIKVFN